MTPGPSDRWRSGIVIPVLVLLAGAVFAPAWQIGFVLDDHFQVLRNAAVRDFDLAAIFGQGYWANVQESGISFDAGSDLYRPITTLSLAISYAMFGDAAGPYHLENVAWHALASVLVFVVMVAWRFPRGVAFVIAAWFAVAPIHIEPIGSVVLRNEILAAVFGLLFLWGMSRGRSISAAIWLSLALFTKESAIALPVAAVLADRVFLSPAAGAVRRYLPAAIACGFYLVVRVAVLGQLTLAPTAAYFGPEVPWLTVWLTMAVFAFEHYLCAGLTGVPLVFDFSADSYAAVEGPVGFGAAVLWLVGAGWACVVAWRRRCVGAAGVVLFMVLLGPTANLVTRIGVLGAGRLAYLPVLGLILAVAAVGASVWDRRPAWRRALLVLCVVWLGAQIVRTEQRLAVWSDPVRFYHDAVAQTPDNAVALAFLGQQEFELAMRGGEVSVTGVGTASSADWLRRSFDHLRRAIEVDPKNWQKLASPLVRAGVSLRRERALLEVIARAAAGVGAAPPRAAEVEALRRYGELLHAVRPAVGEWSPISNAARQVGLDRLRGAPSPAQLAALRDLVVDPRFARELAADLGSVLPDVLIARSRVARAERAAESARAGELDADGRASELAEVRHALAALARLEEAIERATRSGGDAWRSVYSRLAGDLFANGYRGMVGGLRPRLAAAEQALR